MCGRVEWYTILYVICKQKENDLKEEEYGVAASYISTQLKRFWKIFKKSIEPIYFNTINLEKSLVPQILYCLQHSGALDDENSK